MTTTSMSTNGRPVAARCLEIKERLRDFADERLGPTATGEVQGHLLSCEECSEAFGDLLMEDVESGAVPLLTPPTIPPIEWYDAYMRAESKQFGVFWKSVRGTLQAADENLRQWADEKRHAITRALDDLVNPDPFGTPALTRGAIRVRGAVRTRGAAQPQPQPPPQQPAEVISRDGVPTGSVAVFTVTGPPRITRERRFRLDLSTEEDAHDDRLVICTISGSGGATVSFTGTMTHRAGERLREVHFDEADVPGAARTLPLERISLSVLAS